MVLAQFRMFPDQASTVAGEIDALTGFLTLVTGFFTVLIAWLVIYFGIKYRRRAPDEIPPPVKGSWALEIGWSVVPLVIGLVIFFWSARVYFAMYRPPDDTLNIYVVAKQWMWKLQHPDGQSEINALHVPLGQPVKLTMISEDVIHSFYVPAFRIKQDVLPGRYSSLWFEATQEGVYDLFCTEYCGTDHSRMIGKVHVMRESEYERWLKQEAQWSAAVKGRQLFLQLRCIACHGKGSAYAPLLENLHGRDRPLADGRTVVADDDYIRRSILTPKNEVVAAFRPLMPSFQGQLGDDAEEKILQLSAFIKSLRTGDTPPRVENTEAPVEEEEKK